METSNVKLFSPGELACKELGFYGTMISGSKSGYSSSHPKNFAIFNANLCTAEGKIWFGDIDVTLSKEALIRLASELNKTIYVLYEHDGRFDNEASPKIDKAAVWFNPDGTFEMSDRDKKYYGDSLSN